jgi:hypothetical protein
MAGLPPNNQGIVQSAPGAPLVVAPPNMAQGDPRLLMPEIAQLPPLPPPPVGFPAKHATMNPQGAAHPGIPPPANQVPFNPQGAAVNGPYQGATFNGLLKPRTFRQFFDGTSRDPCRGNYTRVMQRFDPEAPTVIDQAYLCCASTHRRPRIYCLLLPSKFTIALDGQSTPWDNNLYATLGELNQDVATTVCFPATTFNTVQNALAFTEEHIRTNLVNNNGLEVFPPLTSPNAHVTPITTRYLMYLLSKYVPLFLDSGGYTLKQVWEVLPPVLEQNRDTENCQALIKWLRAASHGIAAQNPQGQPVVGPPSIAIPLVAPVADKDLISHCMSLLKQALTGWGQPTESLESALCQMAQAVLTQTNDNHVARDARAAEAQQPTLPSAKFKNTFPILMDYLQVRDEIELPPLWHQWANSNKCQEFSVLRELLDTYSRSAEAFYNMALVVSAKLIQDLLSFTFSADTQED